MVLFSCQSVGQCTGHMEKTDQKKNETGFFFFTKLPCDSFLDFKQHDEPPLPAAHSNMASNLWLQGPAVWGKEASPSEAEGLQCRY